MAEEKELELDVELDDEKSNKKMLIFIIAGAVALIGITVGLTLFLLSGDDAPEEGEEDAAPVVVQLKYIDMKPPFTVNYQVEGRTRIMQVNLSLAYRNEGVDQAVKLHMPLIRHNLINLIGGQDFNTLRTMDGREQLRQKILESVQQVIEQETGEAGVENVLFTNFVMQ